MPSGVRLDAKASRIKKHVVVVHGLTPLNPLNPRGTSDVGVPLFS